MSIAHLAPPALAAAVRDARSAMAAARAMGVAGVSSVELGAPFADTEPGRCVEREMKRVSLTKFDGAPVSVKKSFTVD